MNRRALLAATLALMPLLAGAESRLLWKGGLWNLDYPDAHTGKYGGFRLLIEPDIAHPGGKILRVEWVETIDGKGERLYASRLIPELSAFISAGPIRAELGEMPSDVRLQNAKGRTLWLILREPARYAIQRTLK